jgi:hypothetical protein
MNTIMNLNKCRLRGVGGGVLVWNPQEWGGILYLLIRSVRVGVSEGDLMPSYYRYLMPTYIQAYMDTYK